ncbi:MAG: NifB/NifX family molybdenum-iron cluster-binding protein [Phycisphaerae bacterium]|nr:NifB/NifX family molybdenum-iron cluster-binding protein [Phycisphaerae bacterium]
MKIAVTATEPHLDAQLDPRFGRCPFFVIVETDDLSFEAIDNENQALGHGAGIQSARLLGERGVKHVLTGNCGPNAYQTLAAANIGVIVGCAGTVRSAVEQFAAGRLQSVDAPNVPGHAGMGASAGPVPPQAPPPSANQPGAGPGSGQGMGRGMGRGQGRGMGRGGGGGGMGGGGGRGGGR